MLVIDVHVNINLVPLEPVDDLPHQLPTIIFHL